MISQSNLGKALDDDLRVCNGANHGSDLKARPPGALSTALPPESIWRPARDTLNTNHRVTSARKIISY